MHSSLVVTPEGLPLGLAAVKFWTRKKFKGTRALNKKINATRMSIEEKESFRWLENMRHSISLLQKPEKYVHIGDRESDIYELFSLGEDLKTHFLIRTCVDRLSGDESNTIEAEMKAEKVKATHDIMVVDADGVSSSLSLGIKYKKIIVCPPVGKKNKYPKLSLTVIHANELSEPKERESSLHGS